MNVSLLSGIFRMTTEKIQVPHQLKQRIIQSAILQMIHEQLKKSGSAQNVRGIIQRRRNDVIHVVNKNILVSHRQMSQ
jgi:hypothetical protein